VKSNSFHSTHSRTSFSLDLLPTVELVVCPSPSPHVFSLKNDGLFVRPCHVIVGISVGFLFFSLKISRHMQMQTHFSKHRTMTEMHACMNTTSHHFARLLLLDRRRGCKSSPSDPLFLARFVFLRGLPEVCEEEEDEVSCGI
jgi:hypothetical protein